MNTITLRQTEHPLREQTIPMFVASFRGVFSFITLFILDPNLVKNYKIYYNRGAVGHKNFR